MPWPLDLFITANTQVSNRRDTNITYNYNSHNRNGHYNSAESIEEERRNHADEYEKQCQAVEEEAERHRIAHAKACKAIEDEKRRNAN